MDLDEDMKKRMLDFMTEKANVTVRAGAEGLSVDMFHRYINDEFLPELAKDDSYRAALDASSIKREGVGGMIKYSICASTAHEWMHRLGATRGWYKKTYYTDVHEREVSGCKLTNIIYLFIYLFGCKLTMA